MCFFQRRTYTPQKIEVENALTCGRFHAQKKKPADMQPHNEQQANQKTPFEQGNLILTY